MLVERDDELRALWDAADAAREGSGRLLIVEGPAGIGKSSLLDAVSPAVNGMRVLRARGAELEQALAFGLARQLFEPLMFGERALAKRLLTGAAAPARHVALGDAGPKVEAATLQHALTWLIWNLAVTEPVVLLVDDLHWGDAGSVGWLEYLVRRVRDRAVLVIAAWRTGEAGTDEDALDRLRDEAVTVVVRPAPLSAAAVQQVVREALPAADPELCEACRRSSGGNPFLLQELVRALRERGGAQADISDVRPESVQRSVNRRLARLGNAAAAVAEACAVLGDTAELRHVAALAALDVESTAAAVDRLVDMHLLAPGPRISFVHPLVRIAVHERVGDHARSLAHARAARIVDEDGAGPDRVALHLLLTEPAGDPWTAERLLAAGESALDRGAPASARTLLLRALDEQVDADRIRTLLALVTAEQRIPHADTVVHAAMVLGDAAARPVDRAHALIVSLPFTATAHGTTAAVDLDIAESVAADLDLDDPDEADAAAALRSVVNVVRSLVAPREIEPIRAVVRNHPISTRGQRSMLSTLVYEMAISGRVSARECVRELRRMLLAPESAHDLLDNTADFQAMFVLLGADDLDTIDTLVTRGLERTRQLANSSLQAMYLSINCGLHWLRGWLPGAENDGRSALAMVGLPPPVSYPAAIALARVLLDVATPDAAETMLGTYGLDLDGPGLLGRAGTLMALAQIRHAQQRWPEAAAYACRIGELYPHAAGAHLQGTSWRCVAAESLIRLGDRDRARAVLAEQQPMTDTWGTSRQAAELLRAQSLLAHAEDEDGIAIARRAADVLATAPLPLERARSLLRLGELQRRAGAVIDARTSLAESLDIASACGAGALVEQARAELIAARGRPRRDRSYGVSALTSSEERVAKMAAGGSTNRQIAQALFISAKTVEAHLGNAYRKLGISRRDELETALHPR